MVTKFKNHLARTNLAKNTVNSYVWTVEYFLNHYGEVNKMHIPADTRSAFPVISVQSPVSIQCCWQS